MVFRPSGTHRHGQCIRGHHLTPWPQDHAKFQVINRPGARGGLLVVSSGFGLMITVDILQRVVNLGGLPKQSRVGGRLATSTFQH